MTGESAGAWRTVRIWLGELLIAEYVAERERASRYQWVMARRFSGLRITVDPLPGGGDGPRAEVAAVTLPSERLWPLTVQ